MEGVETVAVHSHRPMEDTTIPTHYEGLPFWYSVIDGQIHVVPSKYAVPLDAIKRHCLAHYETLLRAIECRQGDPAPTTAVKQLITPYINSDWVLWEWSKKDSAYNPPRDTWSEQQQHHDLEDWDESDSDSTSDSRRSSQSSVSGAGDDRDDPVHLGMAWKSQRFAYM